MNKKLLITGATLFLLAANLLIFLFRNSGFEYKKYAAKKELYPQECDGDCIKSWDNTSKIFSAAELIKGKQILSERTGIDSFSSDEKKMTVIAGWLYSNLYKQIGNPSDSLLKLTPLQQFICLEKNPQIQFHCGNFQPISSFFFTAAGLPNRLIQNIRVSPGSISDDSHVVNEVFLNSINKWVLTDGFQNHLVFKKNNSALSAAEYLDYTISPQKDTLIVLRALSIDTVLPHRSYHDNYFNKNFLLHYYKNADLKQVYATANKIKRYFFASPWYYIYDPQQKKSNLLFRIKQLFIFASAGWILLLLYHLIKKRKND